MATQPPLILVVDDDVDFLDLNRHVLEQAGFRVVACTDPHDALDRMAAEKPDLVITDLMMESLDAGFSFSRRVKEDDRFAAIPIIIVTAAGSQRGFDLRPRGAEDLAHMRVDAFFDKPVAPRRLLAKVQELLSARQQVPENRA